MQSNYSKTRRSIGALVSCAIHLVTFPKEMDVGEAVQSSREWDETNQAKLSSSPTTPNAGFGLGSLETQSPKEGCMLGGGHPRKDSVCLTSQQP